MAETNGSGNVNGDGDAHGRRLHTTVTLRPTVPGVEARDGVPARAMWSSGG